MTEQEMTQDKIQVVVKKVKGLQGSKGNQFTAVTKVEFNSVVLGESPKVEISNDTDFVQFDFTCDMVVTPTDPLVLDELAQTPVVVTFTEILPKDKKAKEEKTNMLGQCCIDLLPLLRGEKCFTMIEHIHPHGGMAQENSVEHVLPEVEIEISALKPLLSEDQLETCNLMTVCIESAFSLPESWNQNVNQYLYAACMPIPVTDEKETMVLIPSGSYRVAGEKEISEQRKWSCVPNASGSCLYIPNTEIHHGSYEEEDGDLRSKEDAQFRFEAENHKPHITWNAERRCFLSSVSAESLQQKIALHRYWPLEIIRTIQPANVKAKGKEEEPQASYHGIVYVDLAPLLYPGISKVHGAYLIHPYNDADAQEKLQRKGIMNEDMIKTIIGVNRSTSSIGQAKGGAATKQGKAETKNKQSVGMMKADGTVDELVDQAYLDSQQYLEARTYLVLELELEKPLVQMRKPEDILARVAEIIPPRSPYPKQEGGSKKVVEAFENEIGKTANMLLEEFRKMFGVDLTTNSVDAEERRRRFLFDLNTSGKYYAFKENLKYFIVKIVREKFMSTTKFDTLEEKQAFISKLYIFLLDRMRKGLNEYLSVEEMVEVPPPVAGSDMLKHFAKEAETMFQYDIAAQYYQQRIACNKVDVECWFDYGIYCLLIDDVQKAEECFKEVVSLEQKHIKGLLLNGLMYMLHEEYSLAEELFDAATHIAPGDILPWTLLGLYYSGVENSIMAERAFNEAEKIVGRQIKIPSPKPSEELEQSQINMLASLEKNGEDITQQLEEKNIKKDETSCHESPRRSIFLHATKFLLDNYLLQMAERAIAHELIACKEKPGVEYHELLGQLQMQKKDYENALKSFEHALVLRHENPNIWALKGHVYYIMQDFDNSKDCYERSLAYKSEAANTHSIYVRLATIYLEKEKKYIAAKKTFLRVCKSSPSCVTWLGAGISCYRLNEFTEAELALNEANILDNKNADVWAYLTLVCLQKKRNLEAEQCYKYATRLGIKNENLIKEIRYVMSETDYNSL